MKKPIHKKGIFNSFNLKYLFSLVNKLINDTENLDINKSSDSASVASVDQSPRNFLKTISFPIFNIIIFTNKII